SFCGLTFAPSGPVFAARTGAGLTLYRLGSDGRLREQTLCGSGVHPQAVPAFTPDGRALVGRWRAGSLKAWAVSAGRPLGRVKGPASAAAFVYAPDGRWAAGWDADGPAGLWDVEAGKEQAVLGIDEPPNVLVLAPGPGGRRGRDNGVARALHR